MVAYDEPAIYPIDGQCLEYIGMPAHEIFNVVRVLETKFMLLGLWLKGALTTVSYYFLQIRYYGSHSRAANAWLQAVRMT